MKRSGIQNIQFHKLIGIIGLDKEAKAELVKEFTKGRETSSAEMLYSEMASCIDFMNEAVNGKYPAGQKMRLKVFSLAHELGWEVQGGKVDKKALNTWLLKYGYKHQLLNKYLPNELPTLVTQLENAVVSKYKRK